MDTSATRGSSPREVRLQVSCLDLRHKLMYCDDRHAVPGTVDPHSDTRVFFCIRTCEGLGPDGREVHPVSCTPDRPCYRRPADSLSPRPAGNA